jgi:endonuclease YncB( thermonuclease family)
LVVIMHEIATRAGRLSRLHGSSTGRRSRRPSAVAARTALLGAVLILAGLTPAAAPAAASTVSGGGSSIVEYGTVVYVSDGDTIDVAIDRTPEDPDHDGRPGTRVRFLATQAMELHTYHHDLSKVTGECHAVEAAKRLAELLYTSDGETGRRVRLTAQDASSSNLGRISRFVATQGSDGQWHDVGAVLVREGQGAGELSTHRLRLVSSNDVTPA